MPQYKHDFPVQSNVEPEAAGANAISFPGRTMQLQRGPVMESGGGSTSRVSFPARSNQLPPALRTSMESLGGVDLSDVVVQRNSPKPAKLRAAAYAQGNQIHLSPGADKHLPHEAWHVVQQKQNRVPTTTSFKGQAINDSPRLEREADRMGQRAMQMRGKPIQKQRAVAASTAGPEPIQRQTQGVIQRYDDIIYVIHPLHDRVVPWNQLADRPGIYDDGTYHYRYDIANHRFWDNYGQPVANPKGDQFDEDADQGDADLQTDTHHALNYITDSYNRVTRVHGTINLGGIETGRSGAAQTESWRHLWLIHRSLFYGSTEFNGGHIVAHHFGGSPGTHNMVPMEKDYNQSPGNQSYKDFENSLDAIIRLRGALNIDIRVAYPADTVDGALDNLWSADTGNQINNIKADAVAAETIKRLFRVIPNQIQVHTLTSAPVVPMGPRVNEIPNITAPRNPRLPMRNGIRSRFGIGNIYKTDFDVRSKDEDGRTRTKHFHPYRKSYGDHHGEDVAQDKDYEHDYANLYKNMPKPGISNFLPPRYGLAGGVEAYVWMDPMGIFNKFGGTDTVDTVDPLGTNWAYFRKAFAPAHAGNAYTQMNRIYKKGHLLNALLHGPGTDSRNLVPLTGSANADMSTNFEDPVKRLPALVNPRKGVIWRVETRGRVTRPGNWQLGHAQATNSGNLWQQEQNLPASLLCQAWEANLYKGIPRKGHLLVQHTVQNKLQAGDTDGELTRTQSGLDANDIGIAGNVPQGNNAVNTYNHPAYQVNPAAFDAGYRLAPIPPATTPADLEHYNKGVKDRGYDDGYRRQVRPFPRPALYDEHYDRGLQRVNRLEGKDNRNLAANRSAEEQRAFNRGQREFGEQEARNLRNLPHNSSAAAIEGHTKGIKKIGYDHGYANAGGPQSDNAEYLRGFIKGQYNIGYDDAYDRGQTNRRQHDNYVEGNRDGFTKRGKHDGEDDRHVRYRGNRHYLRGYDQGQELAGYEAGRSDEQNVQGRRRNRDFNRGYEEGQYERGRSHGERGRRAEVHLRPDDPYNRGHRRGTIDLGRRDGRRLRPPMAHASRDYMTAYNEVVYQIGHQDGYDNAMRQADNLAPYRQGFRDGEAERLGYNEGLRGLQNSAPRNRPHTRGHQNGTLDRPEHQRGGRDGYRLLHPDPFGGAVYRRGHAEGVGEKGYDDGNNARVFAPVQPGDHDYMAGFNRGRENLGTNDGYNENDRAFPFSDEYMRGYQRGTDNLRQERQQEEARQRELARQAQFQYRPPHNGWPAPNQNGYGY